MLPVRDNIPTTRVPYVTYALIAANIVVYFFWQRGGLSLGDPSGMHYQCQLAEWAAVPGEITHSASTPFPAQCGTGGANPFATIFTAMFMHAGLLHLGGNMLFLWIFGNNVEDAMGPLKYLLFYVLSGIAALALQIIPDYNSLVPTLGASGAIAGVLGGYIRLFPRAKVITVIFIVFFFTILELPAMLVLGFWFVEQALFAANSIGSSGGGVAYFAHVGGFVFGLLAVRAFTRRRRSEPRVAFS
jgi:membrane associated rhomboid family serine protease